MMVLNLELLRAFYEPMAEFSLTVTASPWSTDQHPRALRFAHALHAEGHTVRQVFFYQDAVQAIQAAPIAQAWEALATDMGCELFLCVSAAERRAVTTVDTPWQLVGLGDWVTGLQQGEHLHFG
ncbi:DsrE/DsrF/TusD sulfur relay family protein [Salinispirillum marinum]|uniref:DsrE/DsrF/TusD sulfur relay family protein n=2 Tax=Saccharospirillaceae TaxID=255527 RepID=A0ABV8BFJ3_9GAMM